MKNMARRWNSISITPTAQLAAINKTAKYAKILKVQVDSGGCHGFQYKMELVEKPEDDDLIFTADGQRVAVDPLTLGMINGSKVDFVEELISSSFQVTDNPKAESSCGCKISFNIKE